MAKNESEIWKSLPGVPGVEVSTFGNVRTLDRVVPRKNGTYHTKGRVLKQSNTSHGYLQVSVKVDGKWINKSVHQLIAQTFLPNPDNLPDVNHKDCNRINNHVDNLEFCTASYNNKYREKYGKAKGVPVFAISLSTFEVLHFRSQSEAGRVLGVSQGNINGVIKGRHKQTGGFLFVNANGNVDDCLKEAYDTIKDRQGKMIDGVFIKNSDLEE